MINIKNLKALSEDKKEILKDITLEIKDESIYLILGQNGAGKSTLGKAIMGIPDTQITGSITFDGKEISDLPLNERAKIGIFLAHQNPIEVPGIKLFDFLHAVYNTIYEEKIGLWEFHDIYLEAMKDLQLPESFIERGINENFSGGEKKKSEILQMLILKPKVIILDEIDSGLDIDSVKTIFKVINKYYINNKPTILIISHNPQILKHIEPNEVVLIEEGKIKEIGNIKLAKKIIEEGYSG